MEIKYKTSIRVWDKIEKKMVFVNELIGSGGDILLGADDSRVLIKYPSYSPEAIGFWENPDRFVTMDCSVDKDKAEKLIYSGDLVEDNDGHKWYVTNYQQEENVFLIRYIIIPEKAYLLSSLEADKNLKIFGNIYENAELKLQIKNAQ